MVYLALFIIVLSGIVVRILFLSQPMRYDEAGTFLYYASKPLYVGISTYTAPNNHILNTVLIHGAYRLFGNHPWVIRLPAFLAGCLLIPATFLVTRLLYSRTAALFAAGLVSASSFLIEYSTSGRGYTLIVWFFLLILSLAAYLQSKRNTAAWLLLSIFAALGFYTIPIMLYPYGMVMVWLLLSALARRERETSTKDLWVSLAITGLLVFILYVPVLIATGPGYVFRNKLLYHYPINLAYFLDNFPGALIETFTIWNRDLPTILSYFLAGGFLLGLVFHPKISSHPVPFLLAAVVWIVPVLLVQRMIPFPRIWLFLMPIYFAISASGLDFLINHLLLKKDNLKNIVVSGCSLLLSLLCLYLVIQNKSIILSNESGTLRDAENIAWFLKDKLKPKSTIIAIQPSDMPLYYYFTLLNLPLDYFYADPTKSISVYAVVNKTEDQTLEGVLLKAKLDKSLFHPEAIAQYDTATLYRLYHRAESP